MKRNQGLNIEINFLEDDNVAAMMLQLNSGEALGIYIALLLHLRTEDNYMASCQPLALKAISRRNGLNEETVGQVIRNFGLFEVDEENLTFHSYYLDKVMARLDEKCRINAENGKKGGRPRKNKKSAETPMDKGRKPNESQEKRGEERISITTVVSNSSNTGGAVAPVTAAAVAVCSKGDEKQKKSETATLQHASARLSLALRPLLMSSKPRDYPPRTQDSSVPIPRFGNHHLARCQHILLYMAHLASGWMKPLSRRTKKRSPS